MHAHTQCDPSQYYRLWAWLRESPLGKETGSRVLLRGMWLKHLWKNPCAWYKIWAILLYACILGPQFIFLIFLTMLRPNADDHKNSSWYHCALVGTDRMKGWLRKKEDFIYHIYKWSYIHFISWSIPSNSSKCSIVAIVQCMRNYSTGNETRKLLGNEARNLLGNKTRKLSFLILHLQTSTVICIQNATVNVRLLTYL